MRSIANGIDVRGPAVDIDDAVDPPSGDAGVHPGQLPVAAARCRWRRR